MNQGTLFTGAEELKGMATIDESTRYRYDLGRWWSSDGDLRVNFIMLNPSTADSTASDPTVRKCITFARAWGFDGIWVTNLFGWRATDPGELKRASDPVGPLNDEYILRRARDSELVVCAWGVHGALHNRAAIVLDMLRHDGRRPHALKLTKDGVPGHPLYLPGSSLPFSLGVKS
jgi:hypothetical protein